MPTYIINLKPINPFNHKPQGIYLRTVGNLNGRMIVDTCSYDKPGALRFYSDSTAQAMARSLANCEDAVIERIDNDPPDQTCLILLDPGNDVYLHAAVACSDGWLRAVGGCRENAMRFVTRDAATRLRHQISGYPDSCIV